MVFRRSEEIPMSPRNKRQINEFIAQELLYEYCLETLDPERLNAVKQNIDNNPSIQKTLNDIKYGLAYADALGKTTLSKEYENRLKTPPTYLSELIKIIQFEKWPTWAKWTSESLLIGGMVTIIVSFVPWHFIYEKIERKTTAIILAEADSNFAKPITSENDLNNETPLFIDDKLIKDNKEANVKVASNVKDNNKNQAASTSISTSTSKIANETGKFEQTTTVNTKNQEIPKTSNIKASAALANSTTSAVASNIATPTKINPTTKTQGFLNRGTLYVSNLEATSIKLVKIIQSAGGRKAGSVPLGWSKDSSEKYFHFTLPSAQLEVLQKELKTYGKFEISKEKHPRIMPDGISRVILSVYEAEKTPTQDSATTEPPMTDDTEEK